MNVVRFPSLQHHRVVGLVLQGSANLCVAVCDGAEVMSVVDPKTPKFPSDRLFSPVTQWRIHHCINALLHKGWTSLPGTPLLKLRRQTGGWWDKNNPFSWAPVCVEDPSHDSFVQTQLHVELFEGWAIYQITLIYPDSFNLGLGDRWSLPPLLSDAVELTSVT